MYCLTVRFKIKYLLNIWLEFILHNWINNHRFKKLCSIKKNTIVNLFVYEKICKTHYYILRAKTNMKLTKVVKNSGRSAMSINPCKNYNESRTQPVDRSNYQNVLAPHGLTLEKAFLFNVFGLRAHRRVTHIFDCYFVLQKSKWYYRHENNTNWR